ncbi:unannotated protein [freshwater metagenome]|uniref:Unannotated protein n=1 Tax=freshwater metagenome TaxID=449393 RepID=A0A6J7XVL8_9ZZZZ|nr:hypothetical protein [Actinomycetota bacterium]
MKSFSKARKSRGWIALIATLIGLSFGGYTYVHRAITEQVYVTNCGTVDFKPDSILKYCGDGAVGIGEITWDSWSASGARGIGKYFVNNCLPNCAEGTWDYQKVEIALSRVKTIQSKEVLTYIKVVSFDSALLPEILQTADEWSLEMAG